MPIIRVFKGLLSLSLYALTVIAACFLIILPALAKWLLPAWRERCDRLLDRIAAGWIEINGWHQRWLTGTDVRVKGDLDKLSRDEWYMLTANHQSWVDIMILVRVLNGRIPYVKFFFKKELLWIPFFGQALWALDFPVMHRHSKAQVAKDPDLAQQDVERTRRACEIFQHTPVTMVNFLEGTRFTPAKHKAQGEIYRHLLRPKAGGVAYALSAMNGQLHYLLDATLYYPEGQPTFWEYACGRVPCVELHLRKLPISDDLIGDYHGDQAFRARFQDWVNQLWREKDERLEQMMRENPPRSGG